MVRSILSCVFTVLLILVAGSAGVPVCARVLPAASIPAQSALCRAAILQAERATHVPDRLLDAIAMVESGRRDPASGAVYPWPWTINVDGVGHFYESKEEAVSAVQGFRASGARSIDVGCVQVSLLYHPDAFASIEQAFDPVANAAYGARFLVQLFEQTNAWPLAAAAYHSLTPDLGAEYARKVLAAWGVPELPVGSQAVTLGSAGAGMGNSVVRPGLLQSASGSGGGGGLPATVLPSGREAMRMLPVPGMVGAPGVVGRGLSAYRSTPIALAFRLPRNS